MKYKHLTFDDRLVIQEQLTLGHSFRSIASSLGKSPTGISKEVKKHVLYIHTKPYGRLLNACIHRFTCQKNEVCTPCEYKRPKDYCRLCSYCNQGCPDYIEEECSKLKEAPYVCNPCPNRARCSLIQHFYDAKKAQKDYETSWREDRQGFYLTGEQMLRICELITPRLRQGHSPYAVMCDVKDQLPCGLSTIYRLINQGELEARNADLPRKMRFKPSKAKKKREHKVNPKCYEGRSYDDYLVYLQKECPAFTVEMDTLEGKKGGPVTLSLAWKEFSLLRLHWREHNDAHSVKEWMDGYEKKLGLDLFKELFPVILTDRGSEFSDPEAIEFSPITGEQRTRVFYCDPQRSDQKGAIERNHAEVRRIIPKGTDLNKWPQTSLNQVCDHLNSYPRKRLKGKSANDSFCFFMGTDIPELLGWKSIPTEDIFLKTDYFR